MKKKQDDELVGVMSEPYTEEIHKCISDNLTELAKMLNSPLYQKTVQVRLRSAMNQCLNRTMGDKMLSEREYCYAVGFMAGIRVAYSLPADVKKAIEGGNTSKPPAEKGGAGY